MSIPDYVKPGGEVIWDGERVTVIAASPEPALLVTTSDGERIMVGTSVISKAPPIVPTEPGWYLVPKADAPSGVIAIELLGTGEWVDNTDGMYLTDEWIRERESFTRLHRRDFLLAREVIVQAVLAGIQSGSPAGSVHFNDVVFGHVAQGLRA